MTKILGLDAATKKTGFGLINEDGSLFKYGLIQSSLENTRERMKDIYKQLKEIIKENDIKVVVVEDVPISSHNNLKTGKDLSILHGVIMGLCFEQCLPYVVYNPSSWRSLVGLYTGTREGTKRDFQKQAAVDKVNNLYNLSFNYYKNDTKDKKSDDDIAEAICIALAYLKEKEGGDNNGIC